MHTYAFAIVAAALFAVPTSGLSQGIEIGPGGVRVDPGYGRGDGYNRREGYDRDQGRSASREKCRELRLACLHKEEMGEQGQGNCRRYHKVCQGG